MHQAGPSDLCLWLLLPLLSFTILILIFILIFIIKVIIVLRNKHLSTFDVLQVLLDGL